MLPPTCAPPVKRAAPGNISACIASLTCKGTKRHDPVGDVTGYWLFACSAATAKVNRWASHLFTPSPALDRQSHGTEPRGRHGQWCGLLTVSGDAPLYVLPDQAVAFRWGNFANRHICFHLISLWRQICGSFGLDERWNERSRLAVFTFLRVVPAQRVSLTPRINFGRDEVGRNSWNSNNSLMYIPIVLTFR